MITTIYLQTHTPFAHVPAHVSLAVHLHSPAPELPEASQYSPVKGSAHDTRDEVHLQMPLPLLMSQNSPLVSPAHNNDLEHLQTLLAASQYAPVLFPKQDEDVPHLHDPPMQISPVTLHVTP